MKYEELTEKAKRRAREAWREAHEQHDDWWEYTYEYATTVGKVIGIDIGNRTMRCVNGKSYEEPDISFSGFCSQGDGLSFGGYVRIADMKNCVERLKTEIGEDNPLIEIAHQAEALYTKIWTREMSLRILPDPDDIYDCHTGMRVRVDQLAQYYSTRIVDDDLPEEVENATNALLNNFADWIYKQLKAEDEYFNSDECIVDEIANDNGAEFDEDGNPE